ncbi:MAG TPA: hypothetical protein VJK25_01675 [Patescibacteria group bacterium]|nr:hypothetical protein [Patescibacteria group bacterium]
MLKFNKHEIIKNLILIGILILVVTVFDIPLYQRINNIYSSLSGEKVLYNSQFRLGNSYERSLQDFKNYQSLLPALEQTFLKTGKELLLITKLEDLAEQYNLQQNINLSSDTHQLSEQIMILGLEIDLAGNYGDLVGYVQELEKNKFEVNINSLNIQRGNQGSLSINLLTNTYWLN